MGKYVVNYVQLMTVKCSTIRSDFKQTLTKHGKLVQNPTDHTRLTKLEEKNKNKKRKPESYIKRPDIHGQIYQVIILPHI